MVNTLVIRRIITAPGMRVSFPGMGFCLWGVANPPGSLQQKIGFFLGAAFLLIGAIQARQRVFVVLELIAVMGSLMAFLPWSMTTKTVVPIVIAVMGLFGIRRFLKDALEWLGAIGCSALAVGFATNWPAAYNTAAIVLVFYSVGRLKKHRDIIAWPYLILNILFAWIGILNS